MYLMKVIETIGRDNVKLSEKQVEELVELLDKEEVIEAEEKIEKALAKSLKESSSAAAAKSSSKEEELKDNAKILEDKATDLSALTVETTDKKDAQSNVR